MTSVISVEKKKSNVSVYKTSVYKTLIKYVKKVTGTKPKPTENQPISFRRLV